MNESKDNRAVADEEPHRSPDGYQRSVKASGKANDPRSPDKSIQGRRRKPQ